MLMECTDKVPRWRKTVPQTETFLLYRESKLPFRVSRFNRIDARWIAKKKRRNKNTSKRNESIMGHINRGGARKKLARE